MKDRIPNINFEITSYCNQNCQYCYYDFKKGSVSSDLNPLKTLDQLFKVVKTNQITFTGGEPTTSPYLRECVIHARLNGAKVALITNASIPDQKLFKDLIKYGVSHFQITINSTDPAIHDEMAGKKGSWHSTINNMEFILNNGGVVVPTIVISKKNYKGLNTLFPFLINYGFKRVMANRYNLSQGKYYKELSLSDLELKNSFSEINSVAAANNLTVTSNVCTPFCIINPEDFQNITFGACPDDPRQKPITLDSKGNVRLCNHSNVNLGNIFTHKFKEMLFSDYSLSWSTKKPDFCANCELYENCKGGCRAASEQLENTHLKVDPLVEMAKCRE